MLRDHRRGLLFGHAFWTQHEHERSLQATALVWLVFDAAVAYVKTRVVV